MVHSKSERTFLNPRGNTGFYDGAANPRDIAVTFMKAQQDE